MENSILFTRVAAFPQGLGTLEELKRYLRCKQDCARRMREHDASHHSDAKLKELTDKHQAKISALQLLVEYMDANGAPDAQTAILARMQEFCCPVREIEQYLIAIENLPKFLVSERKPAMSLSERLVAIAAWRPHFPGIPGLSRTSA